MKFNSLFTLLLASSSFAYHIQRRDELGDAGQTLNQSIEANPAINSSAANPATNPSANSTTNPNVNVTSNSVANEFKNSNTKECQELSDALTKCINFGFGQSFDLTCDKFYTPECQEVVKKDFSACEFYKSTPGMLLGSTRLFCAKDENGKLCPISESVQKNIDQNVNESLIKETTKSKVCTEQTILAMKEMKDSFDNVTEVNFDEKDKQEVANYDKYIAILSEDKSSGATHLKVGSALLFSFVALLLSHF
ncbi:hypothetical protein PIROE2DRAFT_65186 [Piromyces sp. E2]|nr:hypothetical protein PIROE2DRAFT_65186 [Piromyces sp. E2]|eukprot:OUM57111.1 hypothetical protein PIROE2DRAFT_65186 [Piromyces sp. E2]